MTLHTISVLILVLLAWIVAWHLRSMKARQLLLLLACYAFYALWGVGFLAVLIASSLLNYAIGRLLRRRLTIGYLWLGIALNVLLLGFFKYLTPVLDAAEAAWIIMPVGMSFWTFQALSYLIDTYLEEEADPSLVEFCLYMAFWPTVVAGPVCRLPQMLPQFRQPPSFTSDNLSAGALRVVQGVFMKMVLAQLLTSGWVPGAGVAAGFDQVKGGWGAIDIWLLGIGYGFLLFFDFAGYSHIVIGTARIFGIRLPENFDRPFLSTTPSVFWTRWHMSLSFWIRDYVFRPLAAVSRNPRWPYVVLVVSMTLFGLWHGPKWTFIVFGVYHGLLLVLHRVGQRTRQRFPVRIPRPLGAVLAWATTFLLLALGYILFRANDLTQAVTMIGTAFTPAAYARFTMPPSFYALILAITVGYFGAVATRWLLMAGRRQWTAVCPDGQRVGSLRPVTLSSPALIAGALTEFFAVRLWWWFAPALCMFAVWVALVVSTLNAEVSVSPFIYTLF